MLPNERQKESGSLGGREDGGSGSRERPYSNENIFYEKESILIKMGKNVKERKEEEREEGRREGRKKEKRKKANSKITHLERKIDKGLV